MDIRDESGERFQSYKWTGVDSQGSSVGARRVSILVPGKEFSDDLVGSQLLLPM